MKAIDAIILVLTLWFAFKGFRKGLIEELFYMLAFLVGGWAMVRFSDFTMSVLEWDSPRLRFVASGITFLTVSIAVILVGKACKSLIKIVLPDFLDKLLGLVFGGGKILLAAGILFYLITKVDANEILLTPDRKEASVCYKPTVTVAEVLLPKFKELKPEEDRETMKE